MTGTGPRRYAHVAMAAGAVLAAGLIGCSQQTCPRASQAAEGPGSFCLPPGFIPMPKTDYHTVLDGTDWPPPYDPDPTTTGWPRYIICCADRMMMAYVPGGYFTMGGGKEDNEIPPRRVWVNDFYMDVHEVTNVQFADIIRRPVYWEPGVNDYHPVRYVPWHDALAYAKATCKQLPSEAQWELAARGLDPNQTYPWKDDAVPERYRVNHNSGRADYDGYQYTAPVMSYGPGVSPFGIFDMAGNVREWCSDTYDPGAYGFDLPPDTADPWGPMPAPYTAAYPRVVRGGSFSSTLEDCRSTARMGLPPGAKQANLGFRCVLLLPRDEDMAVR